MEETLSTPEIEKNASKSLYGAYSSVYYQRYTQADQWIKYGQYKAPTEVYRAREDGDYLLTILNAEAAKQKYAAVQASSCEFQILKALLQANIGAKEEALEMLKRVTLNYPKNSAVVALKARIKALEYELSSDPWDTPPDVVRSGGKRNGFSKWQLIDFPLKVYIPTDLDSSKVKGYKTGDSQLMKSSFEIWQRLSGGKIKFVFVPAKTGADISCSWVSEQKELNFPDAIGVCWTSCGSYISKAEIQVLTFADPIYRQDPQYRKQTLAEVCMHEIGHSLGLNHSSGDNDVMTFHAHSKPLAAPTNRDISSLNTLYLTDMCDLLTAAADSIDRENFKQAITTLDKIIVMNPKDGQTRDTVCICLRKIANYSIYKDEFQTAINYLLKAKSFFNGSESKRVKDSVLKKLIQAYLKTGNVKAVEALEAQYDTLPKANQIKSASFLDQYGLKRESLSHYEKAFAEKPDDLIIREKFCFLLVTLAKDEMGQQKDNEAITLLVRAKEMLRAGMPESIFDKVIKTLRQAYLNERRYDEADSVWTGVSELLPKTKSEEWKYSPEEAIANLILASKSDHPELWPNPVAAKSLPEKIKLTYEQYVEALRQCGAAAKVMDESTWATVLIVRAKKYDKPGAQDPFGAMFAIRHRLINMTSEGAVISVEVGLPLKKDEQKDPSPAGTSK